MTIMHGDRDEIAGAIRQVDEAVGTPAQRTATLLYDPLGNLLSQTTGQSTVGPYAHPVTTNYGYDALNRQTQVDEAAGTSAQRTATPDARICARGRSLSGSPAAGAYRYRPRTIACSSAARASAESAGIAGCWYGSL